MSRWWRAGLVPLSAVACHSAKPAAQPPVDSCRQAAGSLPASATADSLPGDYHLHLAATSGAATGRSADAMLRLRPLADSAGRTVVVLGIRDTTSSFPLVGTSDLNPSAVGAVGTGSLAAQDPEAPGVLVIERHPPHADAPAEIMLRLGAEANRRGVVRYDGGYFALNVRTMSPAGFAGTWSSGGGGSGAEGYFCAARMVSNE